MKLLFVCGKNRLRSPTAETIFMSYEGLEVDSAGIDREADTPLSSEAIIWADLIFVMENSHRRKLSTKFPSWIKNKRVICLDIPDKYDYMEPALVELLKRKVGSSGFMGISTANSNQNPLGATVTALPCRQ